jgi:choline dehydrogenase-like flavoprotein
VSIRDRYPGANSLGQRGHWDDATRRVMLDRVHTTPEFRYFDDHLGIPVVAGGPVAIPAGRVGKRPHCIMRGFCLLGCKVGARSSTLVSHIPDAIEHGAEIRTSSMAAEIMIDGEGRARGVRYFRTIDQHGRLVEEEQRARAVIVAGIRRAMAVLEAAGATETHSVNRYAHLLGTCRMGFSPRDSVVDRWCRSWDVPNLFVCDGSVLPTQGSANPALTISALAARTADWLRRAVPEGALAARPRARADVSTAR